MRPRLAPPGFALVLVLCVLAVLSVIAVTLIRETREETRFEGAVIEDAKAEALAEGGIQQTMAELLTPPGNGAWEADGTSHQIRLGEGVVVIRIEDESGRIDLNRADLATLESMLVSIGLPTDEAQHLAAAIADYRDPDDIKTPGGAEAFDYEAAGLKHGPKNGPFDSPEEAMQVLGMTPAIMRAIAPLVTVHSPSGEVNAQAASPAVRRALPKIGFAGANQSSPDPEGPALSDRHRRQGHGGRHDPQRRPFHPRGRPPAQHGPDPTLHRPELAPPLAGVSTNHPRPRFEAGEGGDPSRSDGEGEGPVRPVLEEKLADHIFTYIRKQRICQAIVATIGIPELQTTLAALDPLSRD